MSTTPKVWFITGASKGFGRIWAEAALKRVDDRDGSNPIVARS
jgi:NAD(P)-dependent dehydrogenase (short-subunit alcohol dehydrogenase family)